MMISDRTGIDRHSVPFNEFGAFSACSTGFGVRALLASCAGLPRDKSFGEQRILLSYR